MDSIGVAVKAAPIFIKEYFANFPCIDKFPLDKSASI